ncbi:MAG: carboxymuconolactone decarboxylase family protein [Tardiphaga sp.]
MSLASRREYKDFKALTPELESMVRALGAAAAQFGIDKQLLELVKIRASQINGCAFCVQFHIIAAQGMDVPAEKLDLLVVWREAPVFSARERAALAWTEALTLVSQGVSDEVYAEATAAFSDEELVYLSSAIAGINVWNRFGAAFRWTPPSRPKPVA